MIKYLAALLGELNNGGSDRGNWSFEKLRYWNNLDEAIRHIQRKDGYQVHFWDHDSRRDKVVMRPLDCKDDFVKISAVNLVRITLEHGLLDGDRHIHIRTIWVIERTPVEQYLHERGRWSDLNRHQYDLFGLWGKLPLRSPFGYEELIVNWFDSNPLKLD
jgi:hypothetical protein